VRLLLRDAEARQKINDGLCFDLQVASKLINPNLICFRHALRYIQLKLGIPFFVLRSSGCCFSGFCSRS
jgi:hypothetical protein